MAYHCLALQIPNNCDECVLNSRLDRIIDAVKEIFLVDITVIKSANGEDRFSISENGIGICKEDSDIIIYRLQNSSLLKNEERNVGTSASVSSSFKILLKADSAPENIQKAKIFLRTHLEQEDDYKTITLQIDNLDEFQMVLGASNSIQKSTFILMDFDQDTFEVSLHGPESSSIMSARTQIVMLLDNYRSQTVTEKQEDIESIKYPYSSKDLFLFNHVLGIRSATSLTATEESVQLLPSEGVDESLIPNLSTMNLSASEEEGASVLEDISNNPLYSRHFEQALKLGYTEHQISKALHKLGPNCGWNDLLGEVINISADESKYLEVDSEGLDNKSLHLSPGAKFEDQFQAGSQIVVEDPLSQNTIWETKWENESSNLRHIIIDGSNVAMSHGKQVFSCKGIKLAIDWFRERGHKEITAFVPQWRKETSRPDAPITDQDVLLELEREKILVFTPSRRVKGRRVVCYDDRYILNLAKDTEGIIVSNDMYRDLVNENDEFRKLVEQRLLMYSFVNDRFMPPEDPLGRFGPSLENFLRKTPIAKSKDSCPYGKKCTYGNRCRYYHPERGFAPIKSISDTLKEQAEIKLQERTLKQTEKLEKGRQPKQKLSRTKSLFPVESQGIEDFSSKQEKPKLAHSKSLVFPVKTSDYLNEPRKILEKAELTAARERMLDSDKRMLAAQLEEEENTFMPKAILKSSSSQSSPVPSRDGVKQLVSSLGNSPLRTINSPSHLTVPKGDQPERYLSGHLLLAKKLSNEGNETNFFSEHTSSPSSTRTSSPVLASLKPEQKQVNHMDRSFSHVKQVLRNEENLPNLSIFDTPPQRYSTGHWEENFPSPSAPPKYVPQFSDSGQFSSQFSGSLSNPLQYPIHYHFGSGGNIHSSQEHHSLRRSFSSTQQPYRRSSAIADHLLLKPQQSMPLDPFPSPPLGVCRQNSTSDPQIHNKYVDASQFFFNGGQQLEHGHFAQQAYPPPLVPSFDGSHQYMLQQAQQPYQTFENQQVQKAGYTQEPYSAPNQQMLGYAYNLSPSTQQTAYSGPHPGPMHPPVRGGNPQHYNYNPNYPAVNNITQAQQSPNKINYLQQHGTVTMAILPEDEPIVPDDPRYSIYYHLSNVFGEPVVRKVMNRNPHVLKPDDVCALILEYKQEKLT